MDNKQIGVSMGDRYFIIEFHDGSEALARLLALATEAHLTVPETDALKALLWDITNDLASGAKVVERSQATRIGDGLTEEQIKNLCLPVESLETLPVRAVNSLIRPKERIKSLRYLWQVCICSEADLLKRPNMGRKSLKKIKELLAKKHLSLGMAVPISKIAHRLPEAESWPAPDLTSTLNCL